MQTLMQLLPKEIKSLPELTDIGAWRAPRMEVNLARYDMAEVNYSRSVFDATIQPVKDTIHKSMRIALNTEMKNLDIYYSFDGTYPDNFSSKYKDTLDIPKNADLFRVLTYRNKKPIGKMISINIKDLGKRIGY